MDVDVDRDELIQSFMAVTGAQAHIAENYLGAHNWDLNTAVDFYLSHPPEGDGDEAATAGGGGDAGEGLPGLQGDEDEMQQALAASIQQQQGQHVAAGPPPLGPPAGDVIEIPDDDDYEPGGPPGGGENGDDHEEAALRSLAATRAAAVEARREAERQREEDMSELAGRALRGAGLLPDLAVAGRSMGRRAAGGPSSGGGAAFGVFGGAPYGGPGPSAAALDGDGGDEAGPHANGFGGGGADASFDLPEGIDVEEARMLEAAMLGVPYTGRIPAPRAEPAAPLDPEAAAQRALRAEQDDAFEESLAADRAKQASMAEAKRREEEAASAAAAAEAAEAARQDAEAARLRALLTSKAATLPPEPPAGEAGTIQVVVRFPDGARQGRRFRLSDPLAAAFDFVDVRSCGDGCAGEVPEGALRPGGYRLVTQFPRRVFEEGRGGSFKEAGVDTDTAMFVEPM